MKSPNFSSRNLLLEYTDESIQMLVTLTTPIKDIKTARKISATTPCRNSLKTELIVLKLFLFKQSYLINKSIKNIKDPKHEPTNS